MRHETVDIIYIELLHAVLALEMVVSTSVVSHRIPIHLDICSKLFVVNNWNICLKLFVFTLPGIQLLSLILILLVINIAVNVEKCPDKKYPSIISQMGIEPPFRPLCFFLCFR